MKIKKPNQASRVLDWLKSGKPITAMQALNHLGCLRLAARIDELRTSGHAIETQMVPLKKTKVASYSLQ